MPQTDFLVIGSGIAGLTYAVKVAEAHPDLQVTIITKGDKNESNTKYAQGGIAVVTNILQDSFEKHVQDTLTAGDHLCDEKIVRMVVKDAPGRLEELMTWGAQFDRKEDGSLTLGREGGHSENRIVHYKDITGYEVERSLLDRVERLPNITFLDSHFVVELITEHHLQQKVPRTKIHCYGAYVLNPDTRKIDKWVARITLLASGGIGQVYETTTNPAIATGDGVAMAFRAKAKVADMEFVQFHPTALYDPETSSGPAFLISEAVRGKGALLRTIRGERFMKKYDPREELASRDIVAQAIDAELKKSGDKYVYLDCRAIDKEPFKSHFPNIYQKCKDKGIDVSRDMIPVVPAAHYSCGGIKTDRHGRTSIRRLYACGETARTGLHGANRLASNSLLEGLVFAHNAAQDAGKYVHTIENAVDAIPDWDISGTHTPKELVLITHNIKELKKIMSDYVGIVRSDTRLKRALNRIKILFKETEALYKETTLSPQLCELRNMITTAYLIVKHSQERRENKGGFFNVDVKGK